MDGEGESLPETLSRAVADTDVEKVTVDDPETVAQPVGVRLNVARALLESAEVAETLEEAVIVSRAVAVPETDAERVGVCVADARGVTEGEAEEEPHCDGLGDPDSTALVLRETAGEPLPRGVPETLAVTRALLEGEGVAECERDAVEEEETEGLAVGVARAEVDGATVRVSSAVSEVEAVAEGEPRDETDDLDVEDAAAVAETVRSPDADDRGDKVRVGDALADTDAAVDGDASGDFVRTVVDDVEAECDATTETEIVNDCVSVACGEVETRALTVTKFVTDTTALRLGDDDSLETGEGVRDCSGDRVLVPDTLFVFESAALVETIADADVHFDCNGDRDEDGDIDTVTVQLRVFTGVRLRSGEPEPVAETEMVPRLSVPLTVALGKTVGESDGLEVVLTE